MKDNKKHITGIYKDSLLPVDSFSPAAYWLSRRFLFPPHPSPLHSCREQPSPWEQIEEWGTSRFRKKIQSCFSKVCRKNGLVIYLPSWSKTFIHKTGESFIEMYGKMLWSYKTALFSWDSFQGSKIRENHYGIHKCNILKLWSVSNEKPKKSVWHSTRHPQNNVAKVDSSLKFQCLHLIHFVGYINN